YTTNRSLCLKIPDDKHLKISIEGFTIENCNIEGYTLKNLQCMVEKDLAKVYGDMDLPFNLTLRLIVKEKEERKVSTILSDRLRVEGSIRLPYERHESWVSWVSLDRPLILLLMAVVLAVLLVTLFLKRRTPKAPSRVDV
ncbi:MAG: hypothetical protein QW290_08140, partial [Sulfolobales archaeon]